MSTNACRLTSSCSGRWNGVAGAPQARHFTMRSRRAPTGSAPPLNCGVSGQPESAVAVWQFDIELTPRDASLPVVTSELYETAPLPELSLARAKHYLKQHYG